MSTKKWRDFPQEMNIIAYATDPSPYSDEANDGRRCNYL